jgi:tetratricopeptide (TPR) repeat protein
LSAIVITGMVSGAVRQMTGVATAASLAGLLMAATVAQSTMRYNYHDLSGTVLLRLGAHGAALTAFEKATSFSPPSVTAESDLYCNLGLVHRHLNNYPDALRCYQKALAIQSSSFLTHYNLANMYRDLQRYADAIQHYGLAINIKPDFSDAHVNLGLVLEKEGNIPAAINHFREALRIEPHADEIEEHLQKLLGDRSGPLEDQP